ncbi:MAG: hypothetical protein WC365_08215 [Candidatus Babeliales bacterium]
MNINDMFIQISTADVKKLPLSELYRLPTIIVEEGLPEGTAYIVAPMTPQEPVLLTGDESPSDILNKTIEAMLKSVKQNPNKVAKIVATKEDESP